MTRYQDRPIKTVEDGGATDPRYRWIAWREAPIGERAKAAARGVVGAGRNRGAAIADLHRKEEKQGLL